MQSLTEINNELSKRINEIGKIQLNNKYDTGYYKGSYQLIDDILLIQTKTKPKSLFQRIEYFFDNESYLIKQILTHISKTLADREKITSYSEYENGFSNGIIDSVKLIIAQNK